jgi:hypothetical protein
MGINKVSASSKWERILDNYFTLDELCRNSIQPIKTCLGDVPKMQGQTWLPPSFWAKLSYHLVLQPLFCQHPHPRDDHTIDYAKSPIYQYLKISHHWNSISVIIHLLQITFFATSWWCCKLCITKIHKMAQHSVAIPDYTQWCAKLTLCSIS